MELILKSGKTFDGGHFTGVNFAIGNRKGNSLEGLTNWSYCKDLAFSDYIRRSEIKGFYDKLTDPVLLIRDTRKFGIKNIEGTKEELVEKSISALKYLFSAYGVELEYGTYKDHTDIASLIGRYAVNDFMRDIDPALIWIKIPNDWIERQVLFQEIIVIYRSLSLVYNPEEDFLKSLKKAKAPFKPNLDIVGAHWGSYLKKDFDYLLNSPYGPRGHLVVLKELFKGKLPVKSLLNTLTYYYQGPLQCPKENFKFEDNDKNVEEKTEDNNTISSTSEESSPVTLTSTKPASEIILPSSGPAWFYH